MDLRHPVEQGPPRWSGGLRVLWILLNFPGRLAAVYEHGFAYARSNALYFWQWVRFTGDVAFASGALLMAADFIIKLGPLYPSLARRLRSGQHTPASS